MILCKKFFLILLPLLVVPNLFALTDRFLGVVDILHKEQYSENYSYVTGNFIASDDSINIDQENKKMH